MKIFPRSTVIVFLCLLINLVSAASREETWKSVEEYTERKLPQSALEALELIYPDALADESWAEAVKALSRKCMLQAGLEGDRTQKFDLLEKELDQAPEAMKPLIETVLALWYWDYYQNNRWEIQKRTPILDNSEPDINLWDLKKIILEVESRFSAALAYENQLQLIPVQEVEDLLSEGTIPDACRPTLYDVIAFEAINFYQSGEFGILVTADTFVPLLDSPVFKDTDHFLDWELPVTDSFSPLLKACILFQKLIAFHRHDVDLAPFFDADFQRLKFAGNFAYGPEADKNQRYRNSLERILKNCPAVEVRTRILAELADSLKNEGDTGSAYEKANQGYSLAPDSLGGRLCYNIINDLERRELRLETEWVWNDPWPAIAITYRNIDKVYFRIIPQSFEDLRYSSNGREDFWKVYRNKPAAKWNADLTHYKDYGLHTESLPVPTDLLPGYYLIIASGDPEFSSDDNQLSSNYICVSDLALVLSGTNDLEHKTGYILEAKSGEPLQGADVEFWQRGNNGIYVLRSSGKSDKTGKFEIPENNKYGSWLMYAKIGDQQISTSYWNYSGRYHNLDYMGRETVLYTDRSIYRPGQTVNYKGICYRYDQIDEEYSVLPYESVDLLLKDSNNQELVRVSHKSNDFGSFSGSLVIPSNGITGYFSLEIDNGPEGEIGFRVEEYKRPKFEVELYPPEESVTLDSEINIKGISRAFTGASINGASVTWHVTRETSFPNRGWWLNDFRNTTDIARGVVSTGEDGSFSCSFRALADKSVPAETDPVFLFTLHADVTDSTGETRSAAKTIAVSYTAMRMAILVDDWLTPDQPVEIEIETASFSGRPVSTQGRMSISSLQQPDKVARCNLETDEYPKNLDSLTHPEIDPTNPDTWPDKKVLHKKKFKTGQFGRTTISILLKPGIYRITSECKDPFDQTVKVRRIIQVMDQKSQKYAIKLPSHFVVEKNSVKPGDRFRALWGTGYDCGRALVLLESDGCVFEEFWTDTACTQTLIEYPVTDELRGGFTYRIFFVRENRIYTEEGYINVPWSDKELTVEWERFRSRLLPGESTIWTAKISGMKSEHYASEMLAGLYDASLDEIYRHQWRMQFKYRWESYRDDKISFSNRLSSFTTNINDWVETALDAKIEYRSFNKFINENQRWLWLIVTAEDDDIVLLNPFEVTSEESVGYLATGTLAGTRLRTDLKDVGASVSVVSKEFLKDTGAGSNEELLACTEGTEVGGPLGNFAGKLDQIKARKNLNETAFFFPHLMTDEDGVVTMEFTMPEALTTWKFMGFAHDRELRYGLLTDEVVTSKDLMVQPNPPRFVREGDTVEFTVKVSNLSREAQIGEVRLNFSDAATLESADKELDNLRTGKPFNVPAGQSQTVSWRITIPDGMGFLIYKAVGASESLSDGEEGYLPVLSRRILVRESLPLPIRGKTSKEFKLRKLLESAGSDTLRNQSLTVQMTSQPAWHAVKSLPYLMEFPHECSEQLFNRYYANVLTAHIAQSDPKIERIFNLWKATPALESQLEKNEELTNLMIEATPWLRQAKSDAESRRNLGILFDQNRLADESTRALQKLNQRQEEDGLWSWFPGGRPSEYISLYIMTGFGRLSQLGVEIDAGKIDDTLDSIDSWMWKRYQNIRDRKKPDEYKPGYLDALYLYGRSFFSRKHPVKVRFTDMLKFYTDQAGKFWFELDSRQSQAHLALALNRLGHTKTAAEIVKSLKERAIVDEEMGMYWNDGRRGWWWWQAPIETQAMMIEVFDEVADDAEAVEACKVWLLKQKQTQDWGTTRATADAIYALLLRGDNLLASDALVEVTLGGERIEPEAVEAGTGFYEKTFTRDEIKPEMGEIVVTKQDEGVSWGSVHWQYLESMEKITPSADNPLSLKKAIYVKKNTSDGPVLMPLKGLVSVGDELVVRIELRADRDMEFVHMKDQRGSGTEPVDVLSQYHYQDGLWYYQSTRDTATHFFIDYLPKGVYIFEYSTRVQLRGRYQSGIAEIQCMYAPEFNSRSESLLIEVE